MAEYQDMMLGDDDDLLIQNGDLVIDNSEAQEGRLILLSRRGDWRSDPLLGVGIQRFINKTLTSVLQTSISKMVRLMFELDNKKVNSLNYEVSDNRELLNIIIDSEQL